MFDFSHFLGFSTEIIVVNFYYDSMLLIDDYCYFSVVDTV